MSRSQNKYEAILIALWKFTFLIGGIPSIVIFGSLLIFNAISSYQFVKYTLFFNLIVSFSLFPFIRDYYILARYLKIIAQKRSSKAPKFITKIFSIAIGENLKILNKAMDQSHSRLLQKVAEMKKLFDAIPEPILILNTDQDILELNEAAKIIIKADMHGANISEVFHDKKLAGAIGWAIHDLESKQVEIDLTTKKIHKAFSAKIDLFNFPWSSKILLIVILRDITEIKNADVMFEDFIANASHEIRTPLTSILGMSETLIQNYKTDPECIDTFVPMIRSQAERMKYLVDDILNLANVEQKSLKVPDGMIPIISVLNIAIKQLSWELMKNKNKVVIKAEKGIPDILGDKSELVQVFTNLISNSIKYGKPGEEIIIEAKTTNTFPKDNIFMNSVSYCLKVSIIDHGVGIDTKDLKRLAERFYRVDKSRSKKISGSGLGLSIVKKILERHSSLLEIESEVNKGSTFSIYFPMIGK